MIESTSNARLEVPMSILVQLPDDAQSFIEEQVATGRFASPSEFIVDLVEKSRRKATIERADQLLLEGLDSGAGAEATPEYWQKKKEELARR